MSTFIINLKDTVVLSDSTVIELAKLVNSSQPCAQETGTNCQDVAIAAIICVAIVIIVCYGICRFFSYKTAERTAQAEADKNKRANDIEDKILKLKSDLINKQLDFQKELAFPYDKGKDGQFVPKSYDKKACEQYNNMLAGEIEKTSSIVMKILNSYEDKKTTMALVKV